MNIVTEKAKKESKISSPCRSCKRETRQDVKEEYIINGNDSDEFYWTDRFQILQCRGCESFSFRTTHTNSESYFQIGPNDWEYDETIKVYPNPMELRHPITETYYLPRALRSIYNETIKALNEQQPILAGVGLRAVIESVCADKAASGGTLFQKIDNLKDQGFLTESESAILHKVRTLGNSAAHEVKPHKETDLSTAMTVVEHLLSQLYILPKLAESAFD